MTETELNKEPLIDVPKSTFGIKFIFILFGLSSLLAWNAILTELNFFNIYVNKLKPFQSLAFLNFFPNIILQFILLYKKDLFKIKFQLILGLIASIALLIIIPITIFILKNYETLLMIIIIILILIFGLVNALCNSGFFAFVSSFPLEMIIALSTGQGFSGIIMNVIKYIVTPIMTVFDESKREMIAAIIIFVISALILLVCLILLLTRLETEYFKYYINIKKEENNNGNLNDNCDDDDDDEDNGETVEPANQQMSFCQIFKVLMDIDILCALTYIVTFAMFPVAFQEQKLFNLGDYYLNTVLIIYNSFDTLGRYLVSKIKPTKSLSYISIISRVVFLITIPLNYYFCIKDYNLYFISIFLIINDALLALTNGIGTTLCFGIAPTLVNNELKGQAGASVSFFTILGIFLGSVFAFLTKVILDFIKSKTT